MIEEFGDIQTTLRNKMLQEEECSIVISGDTSAGKSSFVNLLLGVQLLPTSALACTSTICRIYNRPTKALFLTDAFDVKTKVEDFDGSLKDERALSRFLREYVTIVYGKENKKDRKEYAYVDIHWPIPNLYEGIVIVDTPGVGPDYPELTKRLFEYLPKALCFIVILDTTNVGGEYGNWILKIHDELAKLGVTDSEKQFYTERSLFICNKWDWIYEEKEEKFQSVKRKLTESWSGFDEQKLFMLSTREVCSEGVCAELLRIQKCKPVTENFRAILKCIEDLIPVAVEENIRRHLLYQQYLMERLHVKVGARIRKSLRSTEEKEIMINDFTSRLNKLEENACMIQKGIQRDSEEKCKTTASIIYDHVNLPSTTERMFSWKSENLPEYNQIEYINNEIDKLIVEAIREEVGRKMTHEINNLLSSIKQHLEEKSKEIVKEFDEMDQIIFGQNEQPIRLTKQTRNKHMLSKLKERAFTSSEKAVFAITLLETLPLAIVKTDVALALLLPVGLVKVSIDSVSNYRKVNNYKKNKVQYATNRAMDIMKTLTVEFVEQIINQVLKESMGDGIKKNFETVVQRRINVMKILLENMQKSKGTTREFRQKCHTIQEVTNTVYGHLEYAKIKLFGTKVLQAQDIKLTVNENGRYNHICFLNHNTNWINAKVASQMFDLTSEEGWSVVAEICHLRKFYHPNVEKIYGISTFFHPPKDGFLLLTEISGKQLAKLLLETDTVWTVCTQYLAGVLDGLSYMHGQGLVHKNVRLENISIRDGEAMLSYEFGDKNMPLSGKINGVPIIKAPEVQTGEYCGCEADIFQFAFVLWECYYRKRAFYENDKPQFSTYEELNIYIENGGRPDMEDGDTSNISQLLKNCWIKDPKERPMAKLVLQSLLMI